MKQAPEEKENGLDKVRYSYDAPADGVDERLREKLEEAFLSYEAMADGPEKEKQLEELVKMGEQINISYSFSEDRDEKKTDEE